MNILRVVKNEFIKLMHQKKFIILLCLIVLLCILACYGYNEMRNDVINHTAKGEGFDEALKSTLLNLNYIKFSILFSGDFIYKPLLPIYLIFMAIILTSVISEDYLGGTMKFSLISPVTKIQLMIGKLLFVLMISLFVALFNFLVSLFVGYIVFGASNVTTPEILNVFLIYIISIAPVMAFSSIVLCLSLIMKNTGAVIATSVILGIALNIVDCFTATKNISPIGVLAKFSNSNAINILDGILPMVCSIAYIIVFGSIILLKTKNDDIVY